MVQFSKRYWFVIGIMAVTFAATAWIRAPKGANAQQIDLRAFPSQFGGWQAEESVIDEATKGALRADQALLRSYVNSKGDRVELFIGYYQDQKFGGQVHSPQHCLPGSGWTIVRHEDTQLPFQSVAFANRLYITRNNERQIIVYWFSSDGEIVKSEFELKWQLLINAFRAQLTSVYFYRISLPIAENEGEEASALLQQFIQIVSTHAARL